MVLCFFVTTTGHTVVFLQSQNTIVDHIMVRNVGNSISAELVLNTETTILDISTKQAKRVIYKLSLLSLSFTFAFWIQKDSLTPCVMTHCCCAAKPGALQRSLRSSSRHWRFLKWKRSSCINEQQQSLESDVLGVCQNCGRAVDLPTVKKGFKNVCTFFLFLNKKAFK